MKHVMAISGCCVLFLSIVFSQFVIAEGFYGVSTGPYNLNFEKSSDFKFLGLSGDGSTVVSGYKNFNTQQGYIEPYSWTVKGGIKWLGFSEPTQNIHPKSYATAVSYDGSYITGRTRVDRIRLWYLMVPTGYYIDKVKGFVWHNNSFTGLPYLSGDDHALPYDISGNGSVVVGDSWEVDISFWRNLIPFDRAVTWDYNLSDLGVYAGDDDSIAHAVSGNGAVIVGVSGDMDDYWDPVVNKNGSGWQRIALLSTATCSVGCNKVLGVSVDGAKAVGHLYDGTKSVPSFWDTTSLQAFALSQLPGKNESGTAFDVSGLIDSTSFPSGKGYVVAGDLGGRAVIWKVDQTAQSSTVERVDNLLISLQLGNKIKGWQLRSTRQVSDNGKTLAGIGLHPNGQQWIWYADLDAPSPANDECDKAENISVYTNDIEKKQIQGTTKHASHDVYQSCSSGKRLSVWYRFTAPAEGFLALDLCGSSGLQNPALSVFDSCWGGLEQACSTGCSGNPCIEPCLLGNDLVKVEQGQDYYIMVSSKDGVPGAIFTLNYQFLPINDECTEAFFVATPLEIPGQTWLATLDSISPCQGVTATAPGVWYKVVGNGNDLTASTCDSMTDYDTKISVYCSGCTTPTCVCVGANDDDTFCGGGKSSVSWCAESGMVYYVFVHGFESQTGNFKLKIIDSGTSCSFSINCHPPNEDCQEAIPLNQGTLMVDNSGTNPIGGSSSCGGYNDIWFSYTTQCDGEVTIDTVQSSGTLEDTIISVYDSCGGFEYGCNDDYNLAPYVKRSAITLPSTGNREHLIRASSYAANDTGTFPLRVTEIVDPVDIVPWTLPDASQYMEYLYQLPVSGGCPFWFDGERGFYSVTADNLPPGIQIDQGGLLMGAPTASGRYDFTIIVGDKEISTPGDSASYSLLVKAVNDTCSNAIYINEGFYLFGNQDMDTDGPEEPGVCDFKNGNNIYSDIWFRYESFCTGMAKVELCGSSFDTKIAVYEGECPHESSAVFCNDDFCGDQSKLEFPVTTGMQYLLRIGGSNSNDQGNGELLITCFNDCNLNGVSDLIDIESGFSFDCNQDGYPDDCPGYEYVCDDDNPCTDDTCSQNSCIFTANDSNNCDDGDICNGQETCVSGNCNPGTLPDPGCCPYDEDDDGDVDGKDLTVFYMNNQMVNLNDFALEYGRNNCLTP